MPSSLFWLVVLAVLPLVAMRRFIRPRPSWTAFRDHALAHAERTRREAERATGAIADSEALEPLRAALRELTPPAGILVRELEAGPGELCARVTSPQASLMLRLAHSVCRRTGRTPVSAAGVWILTVEDGPTADPIQETFDDLAACAARLQTLIADPASARRSVHAPSD